MRLFYMFWQPPGNDMAWHYILGCLCFSPDATYQLHINLHVQINKKKTHIDSRKNMMEKVELTLKLVSSQFTLEDRHRTHLEGHIVRWSTQYILLENPSTKTNHAWRLCRNIKYKNKHEKTTLWEDTQAVSHIKRKIDCEIPIVIDLYICFHMVFEFVYFSYVFSETCNRLRFKLNRRDRRRKWGQGGPAFHVYYIHWGFNLVWIWFHNTN